MSYQYGLHRDWLLTLIWNLHLYAWSIVKVLDVSYVNLQRVTKDMSWISF